MPKTFVLCLDDSGSRNPDHNSGSGPSHGYDWFSLGGILFEESNETDIRDLHSNFMAKYDLERPLHSSEIRSASRNFAFLGDLSKSERAQFLEELYCLMRDVPVLGHACVVDRPGYRTRYAERYGADRWQLCKTAFSIVVERAAKFAAQNDGKLRVYFERCSKTADRAIEGYYEELRKSGMPFSEGGASQYDPLTPGGLSDILYELRKKNKSSPLMQLADIFLWPISIGGYDPNNRTYTRLYDDRKIIDCHVGESSALSVKYSCFDFK